MRYLLSALLLASGSSFAAVDNDQYGFTGAWYNPAVSGQGFMFEVYTNVGSADGSGTLFGGWFTYASDTGQPIWYSLQGPVAVDADSSDLIVYSARDGYFNDAPPAQYMFEVGRAHLSFSDCTHGQIDYRLDTTGEHGAIPLTRLTPTVTCVDDDHAPSLFPNDSAYWVSGTWYNRAASGQGLMFDIDPNDGNLFGAWYTYANDAHRSDASNNQRWYTLQIAQALIPNHRLENIPIYATSGGQFNAASPITSKQVGTASLLANSCNSLTLDYNFTAGENAGDSGTIDLTRPGPAPVDCGF
ncbi:MAG TPA: hypothetical protein VF132_03185 [Rudaea sp.]